MSAPLLPHSVPELVEAVRSAPRVLAVGAQTKPRLGAVEAARISTAALKGILEYEPSEFTFTALAGTPVRELAAALAERGQYLPFDPLFLDAGATLGGTVAAGLSGPGRFRFGGVRDFILGVRFIDGAGRLLRMGGKVVKNAAGFDLPKFFVGSLGRFGVLAEITFKVFPRPASQLTLRLKTDGVENSARMLMDAASTRWEADALDLPPEGKGLLLRLAGPAAALEQLSSEVLGRWPGTRLTETEAEASWSGLRELRWAHAEGPLVKVALTPVALPLLDRVLAALEGTRVHVSAGGNVAFVSLASGSASTALDERLRGLGLSGVGLRGPGPLWYGEKARPKIALAVKQALDAEGRFPALDE
ncbi:MAG TPA: FAD-binding protein [Candidatus Binatia bacterium]|jgi:glycolate oxidase FAD binding subunit|nr:FAD-binding protein [Candidatus Binatia bacterium]